MPHTQPCHDLIEADLKGAESLMLKDAQQTLRRFALTLFIRTYLIPDFKGVLEFLILQANPDYLVKNRLQKLYISVPNLRGKRV